MIPLKIEEIYPNIIHESSIQADWNPSGIQRGIPLSWWRRMLKKMIAAGIAVALFGPKAHAYPAVGDPANPTALQASIMAVYNSGTSGGGVVINPGVYNTGMTLANLNNFEIRAYDVELVQPTIGWAGATLRDCNNVKFKGATFHSPMPSNGQAKILGFGSDATGKYYDVQLDAGYTNTNFWTCQVMDGATRHMKPRNVDMCTGTVIPVTGSTALPRQYHLYFGQQAVLPSDGYNVAIGDYMVSTGSGGTMMIVQNCYGCTCEDVTIYWGGSCGFYEIGGGGNYYLHNTITYGPIPPGGSNAPLLSQSSDGLDSSCANPGPYIENCLFEGTRDDGISIYGWKAAVTAVSGSMITVSTGSNRFTVGGPLRISGTTGHYADTTVGAIAASGSNLWTLTLNSSPVVSVGDVVSNPDRGGSGFVLTGNTIRWNRPRGVLIKSDNGLIHGNTFEGNSLGAIAIGIESTPEANYAHNVTISNNLIKSAGFAAQSRYGAIAILQTGAIGNKDITIKANTLVDIYGVNLNLQGVGGVTIEDNIFANPHQQSCVTGGVGSPSSLIWMGNGVNTVTFANNTVTNAGPYETALIVTDATVTGVAGTETGLVKGFVEGGIYKITHKGTELSLVSSGDSIVSGTPIDQNTDVGGEWQRWILNQYGENWKLTHAGTTLCLEVPGNSAASGVNLDQATDNASNAQRWAITDTGCGYCKLVHVGTSLCVDVPGNSTTPGTRIDQAADCDSDAQRWILSYQAGSCDGSLPYPWMNTDIGNPAMMGNASFSDGYHAEGQYRVDGGGSGFLSGTMDQLHLAYQTVNGDCTLIAKVDSIGNTNLLAAAGLMIREGLSAGDRFVFAGANCEATSQLIDRLASNGSAACVSNAVTSIPQWYQIVLSGTTVNAYYSSNGWSWMEFTGSPITLPALRSIAYVGLAAAAQDPVLLNRSTMSSVNVVPAIVKDNADTAGVTIAGVWNSSSGVPGFYGSNYLYASSSTCSVMFTPTILTEGYYDVYVRWTTDPNRASNAPIDVNHAGGTTTVYVNEQLNNGTWTLLGNFWFSSGTTGNVKVRAAGANGIVIADAVKLVLRSSQQH